jgi:hypothetical protein
MIKLRSKIFLILLAVFASSLGSTRAQAQENKIDVMLGYYSLAIQNKATGDTTTFAALGAKQIRYRRSLLDHFDFGVGYSYFTTSTLSGDSYYGLDIFTQYYPFTSSSTVSSSSNDVKFEVTEKWRPYVGLGFNQRNFQGIQTSYVGFSGSVGVDYALTATTGIIFDVRYMSLSATTTLGGHETSAMAGLSFGF